MTSRRTSPGKSRSPKRGKSEERKKKLTSLDYYHYYLPRDEVESMLKSPGDFLIRESIMPDKRAAIIMSVKSDKEVKHFPAEFSLDDNKFHFSENVGKPTVMELIEHHFTKKVPVGGALLKKPVGRSQWEILDAQIRFDEKVLGEGNFAVVRRGKFMLKGKWVDVACKKLRVERCRSKFDKDKAKFAILREFQIGRVLHGHNRILTVHGIFVGAEELAVVMELCDGGSLDRYIEKNPSPVYEKLSYMAHAANGLGYMHRLNLIHRDVASRNFLVVKRDKEKLLPLIKVADFGLTRPGAIYRMTTEHEVPYLISALECLSDDPTWTTKSDCWSFGVFIWHVFEECKAEPYADLLVVNSAALREQLQKGVRLTPPANMPPEIQALMASCFSVNPDERPSMWEIQKKIEPVLKSSWQQWNSTNA